MNAVLNRKLKTRRREANWNDCLPTSRSLPPPPPEEDPGTPPPPKSFSPSEFHLPETNLFKSIRAQLAALERPPFFKSELEPILGVLIGLVLGAFLGLVVALGVNKAISAGLGENRWLLPVFIAPLFEEMIKAICMLALAFALPRVFPNRRYGVLMGGVTGLGFGIFATIVGLMAGEFQGFNAFARLVATPITQPLFSAFMGIGIFVFVNRRSTDSSGSSIILGLPAFFALIAIISHALANTIDFVAPGGIGAFIAAVTVCPFFVFLLRDFLGGRLNFFHFLEPVHEPLELPPPSDVPPP